MSLCRERIGVGSKSSLLPSLSPDPGDPRTVHDPCHAQHKPQYLGRGWIHASVLVRQVRLLIILLLAGVFGTQLLVFIPAFMLRDRSP
jgi:hypothetical protein